MKPIAIAMCILSIIALGCASTSTQTTQKVKVSGAELEQWLSSYHSYAGTNDANGCVFIVVNHSADRRDQYYDCPFGSGTGKGTAYIDGDRLCTKWSKANMQASCSEVYRIGENRYEQLDGLIKWYKIK